MIFEKITEINPNHFNAFENLGNTYMNMAMQAEKQGNASLQQQYTEQANRYFSKSKELKGE